MKFKILPLSLILAISLFFYSYTQVDLNLTLSAFSIWQVIQTSFQHVGWFNRPLSTTLYVVLLLLLASGYLLLLNAVRRNAITVKQFWQLLLPISLILLFSYNAFSYDLFNYMFDARIVTLHNENPYVHKALDYPNDPWINFMRWTHRTYPYGPVWLAFTIPFSYLGLQFFLPTLFLFKALMVGSFLGTVYFIGKIFEKIAPSEKLFGMAFFAFNPLVIIESLVSAHHDIVMMFLVILAIYFLLDKKYIRAFLLLILSIGIKFATVLLLPVFVFIVIRHMRGSPISWNIVWAASVLLMAIAVILASIRTELQPWYLIWVLPFVALLWDKRWRVFFTILAFGLLLHYVPFLYTGNWDPPIPVVKLWITVSSLVVGFLCIVASLVGKNSSIQNVLGRS